MVSPRNRMPSESRAASSAAVSCGKIEQWIDKLRAANSVCSLPPFLTGRGVG